jgi:hypothetical protein
MKTHCAKTRRNALVNAKTNRAGSGRLERAVEPRGQCHPVRSNALDYLLLFHDYYPL